MQTSRHMLQGHLAGISNTNYCTTRLDHLVDFDSDDLFEHLTSRASTRDTGLPPLESTVASTSLRRSLVVTPSTRPCRMA
jgi:hypothetical protein